MSRVPGAQPPAAHVDRHHDVGIIALAMFGATGCAVGVPQQWVHYPPWMAAAIAVTVAICATFAVCAIEDDVTWLEAGVAAVVAIPICIGVEWSAGKWLPREPLVVVVATIAGGAGAALVAKLSRRTAWVFRPLAAALVAGGVLAALVLLGLALHRMTGAKLDVVPWATGAIAGALLAWRAPQLSQAVACTGIFVAMVLAGVTTIPTANPKLPIGAFFIFIPVAAGIATGIGGWIWWVTTRRLAKRANRGMMRAWSPPRSPTP